MTALTDRAQGAHMVLEAAAADGLPDPRQVATYRDLDEIDIAVASAHEVHRWAQWLGHPRAVEGDIVPGGGLRTSVHAEKYDQPLRVWHVELPGQEEPA